MLTRRLAGEWCGVPIAAAYKQPPPATRPGLTGTTRLRYRQRMGWLLGAAIAQRLFVTERAVAKHTAAIFTKLDLQLFRDSDDIATERSR
jgi:hypothetical protein